MRGNVVAVEGIAQQKSFPCREDCIEQAGGGEL